jgi:hypothetical protein
MSEQPCRKTARATIKRTVEQAIPQLEIDTTRVMTDEEIAELHRQMECRLASQKLASEVGREGLRARLRESVRKIQG